MPDTIDIAVVIKVIGNINKVIEFDIKIIANSIIGSITETDIVFP